MAAKRQGIGGVTALAVGIAGKTIKTGSMLAAYQSSGGIGMADKASATAAAISWQRNERRRQPYQKK